MRGGCLKMAVGWLLPAGVMLAALPSGQPALFWASAGVIAGAVGLLVLGQGLRQSGTGE